MSEFHLAVVGSRDWPDSALALETVEQMMGIEYANTAEGYKVVFISGGAPGVDRWAQHIAGLYGWEQNIIRPEWGKYGKRAGYLRNELIVEAADKVIAVWDGRSMGTRHTIDLALKHKRWLEVFFP